MNGLGSQAADITGTPTKVDEQIATLFPSQFLQTMAEDLHDWIVGRQVL
jgi:hypothetical protein